ncbi:MAG: hypothetical protein WAT26_12045 [Saprospiraceae bacterium]|nr:hypothetical protein [Saprospiraceae bacterium]HQV67883.1 hypothetical protein [Saprospiraceae bacterium]
MGFLISTILLTSFAILAVIDGFYLHIFKYQLFNHPESKFEHLTHTIRAILFPLIVYFLFITQNCQISFFLGILFVFLDIIVLGIDAYVEKDSRTFMGGLPRWEYILHLFVNGFHFASIAVFLALKLSFTESGIEVVGDLSHLKNFEVFRFVTINLMPGAIILAIVHIMTSIPASANYWNIQRSKITCC